MKHVLGVVLALLTIGIGAQSQQNYKLRKVVIDAGHGGKDAGTIGFTGKYEKDVVLRIALKVGKYIQEHIPDVEVIYTRTEDVFIPLPVRAEIANKAKADLFISIHANSIGKKRPDVHGTETFVLGLHRSKENFEVAKKENAVISLEEDKTAYEGFDNSAESYIMFSMMQNEYLDASASLAGLIEKDFSTRAGRKSRGVKQAGFWVLYKTAMPSVLVELGYLSNKKEEQYLSSEQGQTYMASAIYRAFKKYKQQIERNSNTRFITDDGRVGFYVQVVSSKQKLATDNKFFKKNENIYELKLSERYRYVSKKYKSYQRAKKELAILRKDFPDAFIIATKSNKIISISEALSLTKE